MTGSQLNALARPFVPPSQLGSNEQQQFAVSVGEPSSTQSALFLQQHVTPPSSSETVPVCAEAGGGAAAESIAHSAQISHRLQHSQHETDQVIFYELMESVNRIREIDGEEGWGDHDQIIEGLKARPSGFKVFIGKLVLKY